MESWSNAANAEEAARQRQVNIDTVVAYDRRVEELIVTVATLSRQVMELSGRVTTLEKRTKRLRKALKAKK